jgi:ABC-type nitrate/sulfonate/bicarbonate transport system ATPase subunit
MTAVPKLQIENIGKTFFKTVRDKTIAVPVLAHVSFSVDPGSFVSVIGPSGCGKSTLLRIIDGLIHADEGKVLVDGRLVTEPGIDRAVVFQYFGLYPWRDVLGNVAFGLELQNVPKQARTARALDKIRLVGLEGFEHHYPHELSGGMRQRVGFARALALDPDIILMDEPFSAVDEQTRELLQHELLELWAKTRKTIIFVTHSIDEAVQLSDEVVVISPRPGKIVRRVGVELPRPRTLELRQGADFQRLVGEIKQIFTGYGVI